MEVRNRLFKLADPLGRLTDATDEECPCRPCFHPHDFGYRPQQGGYIIQMRCLTREKGGCPTEKPAPEHFYTKSGTCKRCGGHAKS